MMQRKTMALLILSASTTTGVVLPRSTSGHEMRVDLAQTDARMVSGAAQKATGASKTTLIAANPKKIAKALAARDGNAA